MTQLGGDVSTASQRGMIGGSTVHGDGGRCAALTNNCVANARLRSQHLIDLSRRHHPAGSCIKP